MHRVCDSFIAIVVLVLIVWGVSASAPVDGFWSVRFIEILRLAATMAIAILAAGIWNDRSSKRTKQREVFHGIVSDFLKTLNILVECSHGLRKSRLKNDEWASLNRALSDLYELEACLSGHHKGFIKNESIAKLEEDLHKLDYQITWVPFESVTGVELPSSWEVDMAYIHKELRKTCYDFMMEIFD